MATRSIANEPTSAWLPRTKRRPSAIERRTGGCSATSVCGGWGAITTTAAPSPGSSPRRSAYAAPTPSTPMSTPPSPGPMTIVSWYRPKLSASAERRRAGSTRLGRIAERGHVLQRAEAGQQAAEHVERGHSGGEPAKASAASAPSRRRARSGRAAARGGGRCGRRSRRRAAPSSRAGRARPRRAARSGRPSRSGRRAGRAARRARPGCPGRTRSCPARAAAGRATRAAARGRP